MCKKLNPALKATQIINERILKDVGGERKYWFGLITYVNKLRKEAKIKVKDEKDFKAVNDMIIELFKLELDKKDKSKIVKEIEDFYTKAMAKRGKRGKRCSKKYLNDRTIEYPPAYWSNLTLRNFEILN